MKFIIVSYFVISVIGCQPSSTLDGPVGSNRGHESGHTPPSGQFLFKTDQSPAELSALKTSFLLNSKVEKSAGIDRYSVNAERGPSQQPKSPIVHSYHAVSVLAPLVLTLPKQFRWNIPEDIRAQISRHNIDHLDILFTPQVEVRDADASLKPAYWMFPNRPKLDDIKGSPAEYNKTALMALFHADHNIDDQVISGQLRPFEVQLHDGKVSPDTGHIKTASAPAGSFSFYSLVIFEEQRRAVVTLHWMLTNAHKDDLIVMLAEGNSLQETIDALGAPASVFHGTSMMKKLQDLLKP